ncbi:hypothetical protein EXN66_Car000338 [Channa argus]|uniref:Uncharacterized protein n=1 Tax=Channa argus TaxID=215402 RepID=A0A6G1QXB4_CHAAH|nr:hypothetical protein EXN66_Car000338 [Channa argus]
MNLSAVFTLFYLVNIRREIFSSLPAKCLTVTNCGRLLLSRFLSSFCFVKISASCI